MIRVIILTAPTLILGLTLHGFILTAEQLTFNLILEKQQINRVLYVSSFLLFCTFAWLLLEQRRISE